MASTILSKRWTLPLSTKGVPDHLSLHLSSPIPSFPWTSLLQRQNRSGTECVSRLTASYGKLDAAQDPILLRRDARLEVLYKREGTHTTLGQIQTLRLTGAQPILRHLNRPSRSRSVFRFSTAHSRFASYYASTPTLSTKIYSSQRTMREQLAFLILWAAMKRE